MEHAASIVLTVAGARVKSGIDAAVANATAAVAIAVANTGL